MVTEFHDVVHFDGLWLDMNEPSTEGGGDMIQGCDLRSRYNYPPYLPAIKGGELSSETLCPDAVQEGGLHYDMHSLYGLKEAETSIK